MGQFEHPNIIRLEGVVTNKRACHDPHRVHGKRCPGLLPAGEPPAPQSTLPSPAPQDRRWAPCASFTLHPPQGRLSPGLMSLWEPANLRIWRGCHLSLRSEYLLSIFLTHPPLSGASEFEPEHLCSWRGCWYNPGD